MAPHEIRDPVVARSALLSSAWLARATPPSEYGVATAFTVGAMLASAGHALPPLGFLTDIAHLALGSAPSAVSQPTEFPSGLPGGVRQYEDYVLGKLYADLSFERAADALMRYAESDRIAGVAYLVERLLANTGFSGLIFNVAALRSLQQTSPGDLLRDTWTAFATQGLPGEIHQQYEHLVERFRSTGDLLTPEDIFELEHGTALVEFGQRFALRQVLHLAELFQEQLPKQRPKSTGRRRQVATRMLDEDAYPVGGFSSISTRGSIESLLHSQLALIERDSRPDLFDVKYVRDELLYYSRDENQFLRRRTAVYFVLRQDLVRTRIKDAQLPCQRIVAALGFVLALMRHITQWLSDEALSFHFVLLSEGLEALDDEKSLLQLLLKDEVESGLAKIETLNRGELLAHIGRTARRNQVHCLIVGQQEIEFPCRDAGVSQLLLETAIPHVHTAGETPFWLEQQGLDAWHDALLHLLLILT